MKSRTIIILVALIAIRIATMEKENFLKSTAVQNFYRNPKYLLVHGRKVFYKEKLSEINKCTIFIHGFPTFSFDYAEYLEKTPGYTVSFDFVGYGSSEKPKKDHHFNIAENADTLTSVLQQFTSVK